MDDKKIQKMEGSLQYYCKKNYANDKIKEKVSQLYKHKPSLLPYYFESACKHGNFELVRHMVQLGVRLPEIYPLKFFLEDVCVNGHKEIAKHLIESGYPTDGLSIQRMVLRGRRQGAVIVRELLGDKCACHDCLLSPMCATPCEKVMPRKV